MDKIALALTDPFVGGGAAALAHRRELRMMFDGGGSAAESTSMERGLGGESFVWDGMAVSVVGVWRESMLSSEWLSSAPISAVLCAMG